MASAAPPKQLPTRARQFAAVLRKNYLLQTRSRRLWFGGAGWLALLIEVWSLKHMCGQFAVMHNLSWATIDARAGQLPDTARYIREDPPPLRL